MAPSAAPTDLLTPNPSMQGQDISAVAAPNGTRRLRLIFGATIFSAAFLLFFVELLLGKLILPRFGGTPAVWTSCLLVFQVLLLAGYAAAHGLASRVLTASQGKIMLAALAGSLLMLAILCKVWPTPITPGFSFSAGNVQHPSLAIIEFLAAAIGVPFLLLSTTSPLLQIWWNKLFPSESPYRLYALSNAGSLIGLLSYPFLMEPALRLSTQAWVWTASYAASAICFGFCAWQIARWKPRNEDALPAPTLDAKTTDAGRRLGWQLPTLWIALAACASIQLMATTNYICQEVAVIPFLWVLPLCIYLISLILAFENNRWYSRTIFQFAFAAAAAWQIVLSSRATSQSYLSHLAAASVLLLAGCMVCHGEAARLRPSPAHLTKFFLCISFGGAIGGVFVSLLAPNLFGAFWEFPLGIFGCAALLLVAAARDCSSWWYVGNREIAPALLGILLVPAARELAEFWPPAGKIPAWALWLSAIALICVAAMLRAKQRKPNVPRPSIPAVRVTFAVAVLVLLVGMILPQRWLYQHVLARSRNFYGVVTVVENKQDNYLTLTHGVTAHGFQFKGPNLEKVATGYYGKNSGANVLLAGWHNGPMRVGLVGMGAGTLAALGRPGDHYRFYEINPAVAKVSMGPGAYFTFINDSAAHVDLVMGDARMELEREAARGELENFDVLVLDAFSSDAIPVHLLTREAFQTYRKHLRSEHSVIAVHVTNSVLDLGPVIAGIANENGFFALRTKPSWLGGMSSTSDWVLLSQDPASISTESLRRISIPFPGTAKPILWTDDYSNLVQLLR